MNCFYHPERPAVAQCSCGRFLCKECCDKHETVICDTCYEKQHPSEETEPEKDPFSFRDAGGPEPFNPSAPPAPPRLSTKVKYWISLGHLVIAGLLVVLNLPYTGNFKESWGHIEAALIAVFYLYNLVFIFKWLYTYRRGRRLTFREAFLDDRYHNEAEIHTGYGETHRVVRRRTLLGFGIVIYIKLLCVFFLSVMLGLIPGPFICLYKFFQYRKELRSA